MLGGNHGNGQVSLSLPLPITLRCHHVLATSGSLVSPQAALPELCWGCGSGIPVPGVPTAAQGLHPGLQHHPGRQGGRGRDPQPVPPPCPCPGSVPSPQPRRKEPGEALQATSASAYPRSRPGPSRNSSPGWPPMPALMSFAFISLPSAPSPPSRGSWRARSEPGAPGWCCRCHRGAAGVPVRVTPSEPLVSPSRAGTSLISSVWG